MMEIAAAGDDHKALRKIAAALLAKAANGDVPAINSLADRTDGKVAQASERSFACLTLAASRVHGARTG